jgi:hypothetical protein
VNSGVVQRLRCSLGYVGMVQMDPVGRSDGLAFLWKSEKGVEVMNFSQRHIFAIIILIDSNFYWTGLFVKALGSSCHIWVI